MWMCGCSTEAFMAPNVLLMKFQINGIHIEFFLRITNKKTWNVFESCQFSFGYIGNGKWQRNWINSKTQKKRKERKKAKNCACGKQPKQKQ